MPQNSPNKKKSVSISLSKQEIERIESRRYYGESLSSSIRRLAMERVIELEKREKEEDLS